MAALATFVRFRLWFEAGSDPAHATTAPQFTEDQQALATPTWGYYVQNLFEMKDPSGAFTTRERGLFGLHWINTTSGALDTTWVTADYTAVESAVQTFWTALGTYISGDFRLVEHRWYAFGPGVVKPNPPVRVTTLATPIVGGSAAVMPHQCAETVTLRTALRRHWGRIYVPTGGASLAQGGVFGPSTLSTFSSSARTLLTAPGTSQGIVPVVWDRVHERAYGVTDIEVDNIPDIIRRRRLRTTTAKTIVSA